MALTLLALFLATHFFLERYYLNNKEKTLYSVYNQIKFASAGGTMSTDEFDLMLQRNSATHNVSVVIISSGFEPVKIYAMEPQDQLLRELASNLRGTVFVKQLIEETDDYVLVLKNDNRTKNDFLEMWGSLPDGSFFMLRSAMESIKNSAEIAARFLLIIGVCVMTVSAVIIFLFTRKISKPILELADISEKMSNMDFDARYKGKDKTEIAILGNSINKMSENLESTIAELKEANIELKKDNDLKTEIDNMRTEFIANVSHELKTPIALIQGYAEGLKEGVNEAEERDYYCDVIADEAGKMNNMVKQLLLLNQLESGFDTLNIDRFDIVALVKNYVQSAEILTKSSDIKVTVPDGGPVYVWADEFKVEEIIMNYFSNAVHHCKSDSEKRIDVSVEKGENKVKITVFNTGDPISEESLEHIWDKFYKVDKARSREYGGSGVGLSIVKAITDSLGETCGVSNVPEGVAFWFTLDCTDR
ncbi:MAG: HAMP domain-containing histidine kinase [Lachnospiraceae bacterium]|nr:HAMP domain-containing histidine kinase [Lachnospiraceae bacterium]